MNQNLNGSQKTLGPNMLPSDINRKRYYQPKITVEVNPHCADRQLEDQHHLMQLNRNPRLNQLTKAEISRSEAFLIKKRDKPAKVLQRQKAQILSKTLGLTLQEGWEVLDRTSSASLPNEVQSTLHRNSLWDSPVAADAAKAFQSSSPDRFTSKSGTVKTRRPKSKADPNTLPELLPYKSSVVAADPPTFGHRPKSASRLMNPITLGMNKKTASREYLQKNHQVGMSSEMLKELLSGHSSSLQQNMSSRIPSEQSSLVDIRSTSAAAPIWNLADYNSGSSINHGGSRHSSLRASSSAPEGISFSKLISKSEWDNSLILPSQKLDKPSSLILEGSIPVRTEDKLQRYRRKAAGIEFHPFCTERQINDYETMLSHEGMTKPKIKGKAPLTPRRMKQNKEIQHLIEIENKRLQRLKAIEDKHDLIELWSRIPQF